MPEKFKRLTRFLSVIVVCCMVASPAAAQDYLTVVPPGISKENPVPLLICLPAVGISIDEDLGHWVSPAAQNGLIVADIPADYRFITSEADVEALYERIVRVADELASRYPVDSQKIYLVGTSAGGMMAIAIGLRHPGIFAAVGVASGAHLNFGADQMLGNAKGLIFCLVHGTSDAIIPFELFEAARDALEKNGAVVRFSERQGEGHPVGPGGYAWLVRELMK